MRLKTLAAALAFVSASPIMAATCTSSQNWGSMGPPGSHLMGNSFTQNRSYLDCYTFELTAAATSVGFALAFDSPANRSDIFLNSVALYSGGLTGTRSNQTGSEVPSFTDVTFGIGSLFGSGLLGAGTYTLAVAATVFRDWDGVDDNRNPVGYTGTIFTQTASISSPAPEPASYAMMLAGLVGVGAAARRRQRS